MTAAASAISMAPRKRRPTASTRALPETSMFAMAKVANVMPGGEAGTLPPAPVRREHPGGRPVAEAMSPASQPLDRSPVQVRAQDRTASRPSEFTRICHSRSRGGLEMPARWLACSRRAILCEEELSVDARVRT